MSNNGPLRSLPPELTGSRLVFWDFDGVIKESVDVKTRAFAALFEWAGPDVTAAVIEHHLAHGGMSRTEKIPRYLEMAGETPSAHRAEELCGRFGHLVFQQVVDAAWVPGVESYLRANPLNQQFVLVSATPQTELERILDALGLRPVFSQVYGAPLSKTEAVSRAIAKADVVTQDCVFVGDARADWAAARDHGIKFVLRRHASNRDAFADFTGPSLTEFPECLPAPHN